MRSLRYIKLNKGSLAIRQGDQMNRNIYILLSGMAVELKKNQNVFSENITRTGVKEQFEIKKFANYIDSISKENPESYLEGDEVVNFLSEYGPDFTEVNIGEASGDNVLYEKGPRTCTLLTISDAEFVTFDKNTFWKLQAANNLQKKKVKEIIQKAININYDIYSQNTISQIVSSYQVLKVQKDEFLFQEGAINEVVYIVQGSLEISMKYFIKKNFKKSLSKDLKGTLVIQNLTNGIFFVGDEVIFESWKKYKYSVKILAKNTVVYSAKIRDIEQYLDQATLNHMKEEYIKKMIIYKRIYDRKLSDIIQESKKKGVESDKISNNSSFIKDGSQDQNNSQNTNRKQINLKNFLTQSQNKEQRLNLNSFLKQSNGKKNNFDEILSQVQKDKLQTRYLEQSTIIRNCCFQMQQPTYYTLHRSLTVQPENLQLDSLNENTKNQKAIVNISQQLLESKQQNEKNMQQISLENKNEINHFISNHLEIEEWFPQQNDKIYLKKAKQKSIRMSPDSFLLQKLDTSQQQEPISQKSAFYSHQTESFQLSQSKIFNVLEEKNSINDLSNHSSNEQSPYSEYSLMTSQSKNQNNLDKQFNQRQLSYNQSKRILSFSSQLQFYSQANADSQSKTLPNLMRNKNSKKEIFQQSVIENQKLQNLQSSLTKEGEVDQNNQNTTQMRSTQISNYNPEQNEFNIFSNKNNNNLNMLSQSLNINFDQSKKAQEIIQQHQNIQTTKNHEQIPILSNTAYNIFNMSQSFSLEKHNNLSKSLDNKKLFEISLFSPITSNKERIKKGLALTKKDNINFNDIDSISRVLSARSRRIHDQNSDDGDTYYGIAYKRKINFQRNMQFNRQKIQL